MEIPHAEPSLFLIRTEITPSRLGDLLDFIYWTHIHPFHSNFTNVRRWIIDGREVLAFTFIGPEGWYVDVEMTASNPIEVKMTPTSTTTPEFLNKLRENLIIAVQIFEDEMRKTTLYFVWVLNEDNIPVKSSTQKRKILSQIFTGNMLFFFLLFLLLGNIRPKGGHGNHSCGQHYHIQIFQSNRLSQELVFCLHG